MCLPSGTAQHDVVPGLSVRRGRAADSVEVAGPSIPFAVIHPVPVGGVRAERLRCRQP